MLLGIAVLATLLLLDNTEAFHYAKGPQHRMPLYNSYGYDQQDVDEVDDLSHSPIIVGSSHSNPHKRSSHALSPYAAANEESHNYGSYAGGKNCGFGNCRVPQPQCNPWCPPPFPCPFPPPTPTPRNCFCHSRNQSLIYSSSSKPPYCQRIYFTSPRITQCPRGYRPACASAGTFHLVHCPRRRPLQCPNGFWLIRGSSGNYFCIKAKRPLNLGSQCRSNEYSVCLKVAPVGPPCQPVVYKSLIREHHDEHEEDTADQIIEEYL